MTQNFPFYSNDENDEAKGERKITLKGDIHCESKTEKEIQKSKFLSGNMRMTRWISVNKELVRNYVVSPSKTNETKKQ